MKTITLALLCLGTATAFAGPRVGIGISFGAPAPVIVHRAPPAAVVETRVVSPGPGYVWVPGHYTWRRHWVWIRGAWILPPRPDAMWVNGTWNPQTSQWVEAHWELPPPPPPPGTPVAGPTAPPPPNTEVIVEQAPPAPVEEVRIAAPGPDFVWISGYWGWEGGRHRWIAGHWERPPHGSHTWVEPRWEHRGHSYVFIRGFWR